jgi:ABC-type branched-subunit amino acid transport system substrate-binding protein
MLRLINYDDGYEPDAAMQNVNKMIEDIVLAVVGSTGLFSAMMIDCRCQLVMIDGDS